MKFSKDMEFIEKLNCTKLQLIMYQCMHMKLCVNMYLLCYNDHVLEN